MYDSEKPTKRRHHMHYVCRTHTMSNFEFEELTLEIKRANRWLTAHPNERQEIQSWMKPVTITKT